MQRISKLAKVRFKGFDIILDRKQLGEITTSFSGGTPKSGNKTYYEGNIPFIRSGEIKSKQTELSISDDALKDSSAKMVEKGDILYALYGATSGEVAISQINGAINQAILAIKPNSGYSSEFIMNYLKKEKDNILEKYLQGGQGNLSAAIVKSIELYLPSQDEQSAIGFLFRTLDDLLSSYKDNLANYQSLKATMLSKMFPKAGQTIPEICLDGFEGEWKEKTLGSLGSVAMNKRIFKNETSENGDIPFYKIGTFGETADAFISKEKFKEYKEKYPYPEIGDILISASGSIGRTVVYNGEDAYYQDSNIVWLKHDQQLDNLYLKQYYGIIKWSGIEGTTIKRLYNKNILETNIFLPPSVAEQQAIGAYFSNLDNLIAAHQEKISQLETLKKKLLQDMFI
ncbi:restriction endonuclease subunit S [Streptococcus salivarius]